MLTTLLAFALVFGIVVLVHELGHFLVAKAVDIRVERFSIGFGPSIFGFRKGETEYVVSWLPLGGYVKMAGMGEEEALEAVEGPSAGPVGEDPAGHGEPGESAPAGDGGSADRPRPGSDDRDFESKPLWARFLAISGGVLGNFLFAAVAFATIAGVWGVAETPEARIGDVDEARLPAEALELARLPRGVGVAAVEGKRVQDWEELTLALATRPAGEVALRLEDGGTVRFTLPSGDSLRSALVEALQPVRTVEPLLGAVLEDGPAARAGLQAGDRVVAVDGEPVETWQAFVAGVESRPGEPVEIAVERDGDTVRLTVEPEVHVLAAAGDTLRYGRVGVALERSANLAAAASSVRHPGPLGLAAHGVAEAWTWTVRTVEILAALITGGVSAETLSGPVRIAQMSGEVARVGFLPLLNFTAILSVNLAILNLLPIPVLDGGHLLFLAVEGVRGRAVSARARIRWTQVGLAVVAALMIWVIGNDIVQLFLS